MIIQSEQPKIAVIKKVEKNHRKKHNHCHTIFDQVCSDQQMTFVTLTTHKHGHIKKWVIF